MYFRFERREPKPVEYRTLADVPEGVRCVVIWSQPVKTSQMVRKRSGRWAQTSNSETQDGADLYEVIQILDPIPEHPIPKTLADVEDGRCVRLQEDVDAGYDSYVYFRSVNQCVAYRQCDGEVWPCDESFLAKRVGSLTDIYAVACEVEQ